MWAYTFSDGFVASVRTVTNAQGAYELDIDPVEIYTLRIGPPPGTDLVLQWFDNRTHRYGAGAFAFTLGFTFNNPVLTANAQLAAGGAIAGVVTNGSGTGVSGVTVWAYGPGDTWVGSFGTKTAADGSYRIAGVRPADFKVRFMPSSTSGLAIQWYNNAALRADATSITVTAGSTTRSINARLNPSP
jgi:hypothetical protein